MWTFVPIFDPQSIADLLPKNRAPTVKAGSFFYGLNLNAQPLKEKVFPALGKGDLLLIEHDNVVGILEELGDLIQIYDKGVMYPHEAGFGSAKLRFKLLQAPGSDQAAGIR